MFRVDPPPIIRSTKLYLQHLTFVKPLLLAATIVNELRLVWVCYRWCVGIHPKHVEQFTEINKLCNTASCRLYFGTFWYMSLILFYHLYFIVFVGWYSECKNLHCVIYMKFLSYSYSSIRFVEHEVQFLCPQQDTTIHCPERDESTPHPPCVSVVGVVAPYLLTSACVFLDEVLRAVCNVVSIRSCSSTF